jgi:hypothetical protein
MKRLLPIVWGLSISVGALWIRLVPTRPAWVTTLVNCEPFHWIAHSFLYGTLALLSQRFIGGSRWLPLGVVLLLGIIQEFAQVSGVRSFGGPELFDLGVDLGAATLVVIKGKSVRKL